MRGVRFDKTILERGKKIKFLIYIDFMLYFCTFLLVPIIPIYMKTFLNFYSSQIGLIVGIPSIVTCFFGSISYICYKKIGSYTSILISLFIDISACIFLLLRGGFSLIFLYIYF